MGRGRRAGAVARVPLDVLGQVVAAHEAPLADGAGELLLAGVRALVPGELVAAREAPAAVLVRAGERPLAGVRARVGLQVRGLEVVLAAAGVLALVDAPPGGGVLAARGGGGAGRAAAGAAAAGRHQEQRGAREHEGRADQAGEHDGRGLGRERLELRLLRDRGDDVAAGAFRRWCGGGGCGHFTIGVLVVHDDFLLAQAHFELEALEDVLGRGRVVVGRAGGQSLRNGLGAADAVEVGGTAGAVAIGPHNDGDPGHWLRAGRRCRCRAIEQELQTKTRTVLFIICSVF